MNAGGSHADQYVSGCQIFTGNHVFLVTYADITLIRPLLYVPEHYVRSFAKRHELPIVHNPCPADGNTKRQEIKDLLKSLEKTMPGVRERIFGAMQRYPLEGWEPDKTRRDYK